MLFQRSLLVAFSACLLSTPSLAAEEVVVYSARIDELIKPVFDAYTAKTGVPIKFITDKEAPNQLIYLQQIEPGAYTNTSIYSPVMMCTTQVLDADYWPGV